APPGNRMTRASAEGQVGVLAQELHAQRHRALRDLDDVGARALVGQRELVLARLPALERGRPRPEHRVQTPRSAGGPERGEAERERGDVVPHPLAAAGTCARHQSPCATCAIPSPYGRGFQSSSFTAFEMSCSWCRLKYAD